MREGNKQNVQKHEIFIPIPSLSPNYDGAPHILSLQQSDDSFYSYEFVVNTYNLFQEKA